MKKNDVKLERTYEKQLTVFKKPVRIKKLILIGLSGTVLGLLGYFEVNLTLWLVFSLLNLLLIMFSMYLNYKRIIYFGEKSIEVSPSGDVYITVLHGHCAKCDGHLKVVKKFKNGQAIQFIQCDKNKEHVWNAFEHFNKENK